MFHTICFPLMMLRTDWSGLALSIMSSMKSTSKLSRSIVPMESANLCWSSSTSYSRAHISLIMEVISKRGLHCGAHLMAFLTTLPKFAFSSARGISSGFISVLIAYSGIISFLFEIFWIYLGGLFFAKTLFHNQKIVTNLILFLYCSFLKIESLLLKLIWDDWFQTTNWA